MSTKWLNFISLWLHLPNFSTSHQSREPSCLRREQHFFTSQEHQSRQFEGKLVDYPYSQLIYLDFHLCSMSKLKEHIREICLGVAPNNPRKFYHTSFVGYIYNLFVPVSFSVGIASCGRQRLWKTLFENSLVFGIFDNDLVLQELEMLSFWIKNKKY